MVSSNVVTGDHRDEGGGSSSTPLKRLEGLGNVRVCYDDEPSDSWTKLGLTGPRYDYALTKWNNSLCTLLHLAKASLVDPIRGQAATLLTTYVLTVITTCKTGRGLVRTGFPLELLHKSSRKVPFFNSTDSIKTK
jgi:hypothetical protein